MDANSQSSNGHWTRDDLLLRLYGLDVEPPMLDHLASCPECRQRYNQLEKRRAEVLAPSPVDEETLRAQRQAIWARIEARRQRPWLSWKVPAAATALVVMLAVALNRPAAPPPVSDTQFFEEIAQVASSTQPRGAAALESLFDGGGD